MSRRQLSAIGIDAGAGAISAVQVSAAGDGRPRIEAAGIVERSEAEGPVGIPSLDEARRLADVLYRQGFEGRRVVLAVPDGVLLTALLELPPRGSGAPL